MLTIDGRDVEFEPGMTIIRAAERAGIVIPHYCWHAGLSVAGNCRMCLVEIEKMPKLAIACSTSAAEGMVVRTANERVKEARDAIMEFLLINHPLDCPICDQAGECRLQQYSFRYGPGGSRFLEEKVHKPKNVDIGRHIVFDAERCIVCTRCVRFCSEVSRTNELTVSYRGDHVTIETYPGMRLDNPYSGNTVDICPVGALTLKEFRFKQRVWFLKEIRSICPGCARGCNVLDGVSGGKLLRMTPRTNPEVNRWWMCDEGRLSYEKLYAGSRILRPRVAPALAAALVAAAVSDGASVASPATQIDTLIPTMNEGVAPAPHSGGPLRPSETVMPLALDAAARALGEAREAGGPGSVEFVFSSRATNEDLYLLGKLARDGFGAVRVALAAHDRGEDDELLIRKDKTPNRAGALAILGALGLAVEAGADLAVRIGSGAVKAIVAVGPNLLGLEIPPVPPPEADGSGGSASERRYRAGERGLFEALGVAAEASGTLLVVIDAFESPLSTRAGIVLPALSYGEIEGTFTNFMGRVQRVRAGLAPGADGLPLYRIAQEIGRRLGAHGGRAGAQETFTALAAEVPVYGGLTYARLGELGAPLRAAGEAR